MRCRIYTQLGRAFECSQQLSALTLQVLVITSICSEIWEYVPRGSMMGMVLLSRYTPFDGDT